MSRTYIAIMPIMPILLVGLSQQAHAQNGTLTFQGQIEAVTCVVEPRGGLVDGADMVVALPSIAQTHLDAAGQRGTPIPFHLIVGSGAQPCEQASVRALFSNAGDTNAAGRLSNRGSARNVDTVITNPQAQDIDLGSNENSQVVPIDDKGIGVMSWFATYYATARAEPGSVTAQVQYTLTYP